MCLDYTIDDGEDYPRNHCKRCGYVFEAYGVICPNCQMDYRFANQAEADAHARAEKRRDKELLAKMKTTRTKVVLIHRLYQLYKKLGHKTEAKLLREIMDDICPFESHAVINRKKPLYDI